LGLIKEIGKGDISAVDKMLKEWKLTKDKCGEWTKQVGLGNQVDTSDEVTQEEEWAAERMKKSQKRMKENADVNRRKKVFEEGEEVLLATKDFDLSQYSSRPCRKLGQKYIGPYKVVKVLDKGAYKLELPKARRCIQYSTHCN
jgi:hypothetical protein